MTQQQHTIIASLILIIIYHLVFHLYLKHDPVVKNDLQELEDIYNDLFFR